MGDNTDPDKVLALIKQLSPQPFQDILARLLNCAPTEEAIQSYANKYPDKHLQALTMAARLAGYHKDVAHVQNNYFMVLQDMSDSDLRREFDRLEKERKALMERTVDGEVEA